MRPTQPEMSEQGREPAGSVASLYQHGRLRRRCLRNLAVGKLEAAALLEVAFGKSRAQALGKLLGEIVEWGLLPELPQHPILSQ